MLKSPPERSGCKARLKFAILHIRAEIEPVHGCLFFPSLRSRQFPVRLGLGHEPTVLSSSATRFAVLTDSAMHEQEDTIQLSESYLLAHALLSKLTRPCRWYHVCFFVQKITFLLSKILVNCCSCSCSFGSNMHQIVCLSNRCHIRAFHLHQNQ